MKTETLTELLERRFVTADNVIIWNEQVKGLIEAEIRQAVKDIDEVELIDIAFDNKDRLENKVTKIVPTDGIKSMVLSFNYKWGKWFIMFGRVENNNGYEFIAKYEILDDDGSYIAIKGRKEKDECYGFHIKDKSENEILKIALAFTTEELNKLADEAKD